MFFKIKENFSLSLPLCLMSTKCTFLVFTFFSICSIKDIMIFFHSNKHPWEKLFILHSQNRIVEFERKRIGVLHWWHLLKVVINLHKKCKQIPLLNIYDLKKNYVLYEGVRITKSNKYKICRKANTFRTTSTIVFLKSISSFGMMADNVFFQQLENMICL